MSSTTIDVLSGLASDTAIKAPCRVATTANITLSGLQTIDGVAVAQGDRVLVKDQSTASQNGIYSASSTTWARAQDLTGARSAAQGTLVFVIAGTVSAGLFYVVTTANPITIGTTSLAFAATNPGTPLTIPLPVAQGGTGGTTQATARTGLALGTAATQNGALAALNIGAGLINDGAGNLAISPTPLRNFLSGCGLSNNVGTPNTKLDVAAGQCADSTNAVYISPVAGTIDCTTVGANGLDAGTLANSTWYHVYAISKANGVAPAFLASTSATAPTLPATYTLKRRIGSFKTDGSAHILAFTQDDDDFWLGTQVVELSGTAAIIRTTLTLAAVPTGVKVKARLVASVDAGTAVENTTLSIGIVAGSLNIAAGSGQSGSASNRVYAQAEVLTSATAQIDYTASAARAASLTSIGYRDRRGRGD